MVGSFTPVRRPSLQPFLADVEPKGDAIIIDGSALVNTLTPRSSKTFEDYAMLDVLPKVLTYSTKYKRTDIVFDVYQSSSLKAETRSKRGHGVKRRVTNKGKVPSNWRNFLRDSDNKTELFRFLADKIAHMSTPNLVIVTKDENVACNDPISLDGIAPCSHEEADTRIFVHARHAVKEGSKILVVKASDRFPCHSNQCSASPSTDWFITVVGVLWPRRKPEVVSYT